MLSNRANGSLAQARNSKRTPPLDSPADQHLPHWHLSRFSCSTSPLHLTLHGVPALDNRHSSPMHNNVLRNRDAGLERAVEFAL